MGETDEEEAAGVLRRLEESVEARPDDAGLHFQLGLCLWETAADSKEKMEKAAEHFMKSAKLDPNNAAAFKYLGHYYGKVASDGAQRAVKCYQRAVVLNPDDQESGDALCDLLDQGGKESLEVAVCKEASEKSPRAFWAFRRLGYLQVHQKKWSEAVPSLQHAIRGHPTCSDLWEALGLAYQRLGMYTAAIKSYGRAIELEETRVFARIESGNIFIMLGSFRKGIEQFQQALDISPENLSAYYGLSSGLLGLAKECINIGAFTWAASLLEEASKVANVSTQLTGNASSLWKMYGDIQIAYATCFPWMIDDQNLELKADAFKSSLHLWSATCCAAAESARISYQKALRLAPWQANIYADIAISLDLKSKLIKTSTYKSDSWQLPEKMALGALLLEGDNHEFWVALGCLSDNHALKQHCLIRALQLDVSLAIAWAYLGKVYRRVADKQLTRQAFDSARSIDPSLALPWAGMSADFCAGEDAAEDAFEGCWRAVQTLPLPEFQIGLAMLALPSGHSPSSQVFGAICQAVQRAPYYPESHNFKGLICEARLDYQSAVASYRLALLAIKSFSTTVPESSVRVVTINLARSLLKAGNALEAAQECEALKTQGTLDVECLQLYALSLWQLGQNELALSVTRNLAATISTMEKATATATATAGFICRLLYFISGMDTAINSILKMPKELFLSPKVSFIVSGIHALDKNNRLNQIVSVSRRFLSSLEEMEGMHFLIALGKLVKNESEPGLGYRTGIHHLQKAVHMYPSSNLLRQLLGYLLLSSEKWNDSHLATRCSVVSFSEIPRKEGFKSSFEILGAGAVACYAIGNSNPKFSFPTCTYQCFQEPQSIRQLQKCLRQEPWNHSAQYLLILNLLQKAREERFPKHLSVILKRLICVALSNELYARTGTCYPYRKFQLLLSASELCFQEGSQVECITHATDASRLVLPNGYLFFAHLLLSRAYAVAGDLKSSHKEYERCLDLGTNFHIGWVCLKFMEAHYEMQIDKSKIDLRFYECLKERENSDVMWKAIFNLARGLISLQNHDFPSAEDFLEQACSSMDSESGTSLCFGVACMELAKLGYGSRFLLLALRHLSKAQETALVPLPIVSTLRAQAEGSLGSKEKWENNLCLEWFTWPPEIRPAELFLQMHLLAKNVKSADDSTSSVVACQSPQKWVCRAIHTNPSCSRYWKVLQRLVETN
ncbi:hypothetical protein BT93_H0690 [Corymbia citriodora subsp. variegata]|nr:hypothetical protein BT93_H0690 [Corymbia citriodora subsp. variegata]